MGIFKRLFGRKKKPLKLTAKVKGGEMTAITSDAVQPILTKKKLRHRLALIDDKLKYLRQEDAPKDKVEKWELNKKKVEGLLFIYFNE